MTSSLKSAFEGRTFPSVRTVVVPNHAHNVLRSCPEARRVICNSGDGSTLVSAIAKECKKVEVIEGFQPDEKMMKRLSFLRCFDCADNIDALSNRNREGRA